MPQIWMTYREIADMLDCDADMARISTIQRALDRKKSRDGLTRVKLDPELTAKFIEVIRDADADLDRAIHELRGMHQEMSRGHQRDIEHAPIQDHPGIAASR
jgi:hypothetical protein